MHSHWMARQQIRTFSERDRTSRMWALYVKFDFEYGTHTYTFNRIIWCDNMRTHPLNITDDLHALLITNTSYTPISLRKTSTNRIFVPHCLFVFIQLMVSFWNGSLFCSARLHPTGIDLTFDACSVLFRLRCSTSTMEFSTRHISYCAPTFSMRLTIFGNLNSIYQQRLGETQRHI